MGTKQHHKTSFYNHPVGCQFGNLIFYGINHASSWISDHITTMNLMWIAIACIMYQNNCFFRKYVDTITVHWCYATLRPWFFHSPPFPKSNLSLLLKMKEEGSRQNPKQGNARWHEAKQEHSIITITGQNVKNHKKKRWLNTFYEAMKCLASIQHTQYWFQE